MDGEGKALELTQKLEKYVRDNIDQATQDIIASEFVSSISSGLTACAAAMKNVFAPVDALLDKLSEQGIRALLHLRDTCTVVLCRIGCADLTGLVRSYEPRFPITSRTVLPITAGVSATATPARFMCIGSVV